MKRNRRQYWGALALLIVFATSEPAFAGPVEILFAKLVETAGGWRFDVTLQHADTGWEHYANAWRVLDEAGQVLGERTLYHPHVDEQPFTRSLYPVVIPPDVHTIFIEAQDKVHGTNTQRLRIDLRESRGKRYEIRRSHS